MAQFSRKTEGDKVTYLKHKTQGTKSLSSEVAKQDVPEQAVKALEDVAPGTLVDETGGPVETYNGRPIDTDESEDENLSNAKPSNKERKLKSAADEQDPDEVDPTANPVLQDAEDMGMGWPRKGGKTLSAFSDKPHETVKLVAGVMVPMTNEEYNTLEDGEIVKKLRKLKKI